MRSVAGPILEIYSTHDQPTSSTVTGIEQREDSAHCYRINHFLPHDQF
jgi:hypothetical protein